MTPSPSLRSRRWGIAYPQQPSRPTSTAQTDRQTHDAHTCALAFSIAIPLSLAARPVFCPFSLSSSLSLFSGLFLCACVFICTCFIIVLVCASRGDSSSIQDRFSEIYAAFHSGGFSHVGRGRRFRGCGLANRQVRADLSACTDVAAVVDWLCSQQS